MNKSSCLAVIVTYNRLNDLKVCVEALRNQSYQYLDILVVNNGSSDGTKEWLSEQSNVFVVNQENLGGAGGFYTGMEYMMTHDYEFLVMMDDDGIPDNKEVETLISAYEQKCKENLVILNALVVDKDDKQYSAFSWRHGSNRSNVISELMKEQCIEGDIHPFNGTLISRSVMERIGLVKKEMFIWGDEEEYMARAVRNNITLLTVTNAIHYHPKEKGKKGNVFPFIKKYQVLIKPYSMSHIYYRNKSFLLKNYPERFRYNAIQYCAAYIIRFLTHLEFKELIKFLKYFQRGRKNIFL